ncbi:MAG: hypothetical protein H6711_19150 [Myxococcales bacterium]|nr:hypothetical protein [Myxococcales bacterium]
MDGRTIESQVRDRTGLDGDAAAATVRAALAVIAGALYREETEALAELLPTAEAAALRGAAVDEAPACERAALDQALAARLEISVGSASERLAIVGEALAWAVAPAQREGLVRRLPPVIGALLTIGPTPTPSEPLHRGVRAGEGHTLGSGRPGSETPVSGGIVGAHPGSIAADDDPHRQRLAASEGPPSADQSLAGGAPGSTHPVGGSDE